MEQEYYEIRSEFYRFDGDACGNNGTGLAVYYPMKKTDRTRIAVLAMHASDYMGFYPMVEMARRGFIAAGIEPRQRGDLAATMLECRRCIEFLKNIPGVECVVLMAHSQGGCILSCYQYIAENGIGRFQKTERILPFPDIDPLIPADGLMLLDANYGIMDVLALDPAVRTFDNGYGRIPELDIYNPENGYAPGKSCYNKEFIRRFQKATVDYYRRILDQAHERYDLIRQGRGRFLDDEPFLIPGAAGGSDNNKLFIQDPRLLGHTAEPRPLLHPDVSVTEEIVYTVRPAADAVKSTIYHHGALMTTVMGILKNEKKFDDDFGFDETHMWGMDEEFNPMSTRGNVKGIHIPLLCEGNTASHEFINIEMTYKLAASEDKDIIMVEGSTHPFAPVAPEYGNTLGNAADYFADWLSKPGRFLN